jgi:hypothetical protein
MDSNYQFGKNKKERKKKVRLIFKVTRYFLRSCITRKHDPFLPSWPIVYCRVCRDIRPRGEVQEGVMGTFYWPTVTRKIKVLT